MNQYIDGYVTPVPAENKAEYIELSEQMANKFKALGALAWVQCWEDEIPSGGSLSFKKAVACNANEKVCLAWITWPSKEVRDAAMAQFREQAQAMDVPKLFDASRMIRGGFHTVVAL